MLSLLNSDDIAASFLEDAPAAPMDRQLQLARGDKLGHFEVLELIGRRGMGLVYKAQDTKLPRFVALKFLPGHLAEDDDVLERFKREAYTASALNHPNICTVYELGEHEGHPFIAMELPEGETLRERICAGLDSSISEGQRAHDRLPLQIDELLDLAIQIVGGLEAAHNKGITHRDIKPANLFLTRLGQLKILDFGIAKFQTAERP